MSHPEPTPRDAAVRGALFLFVTLLVGATAVAVIDEMIGVPKMPVPTRIVHSVTHFALGTLIGTLVIRARRG